MIDFVFVMNSLLLGVGLAMDAFSVSLANGLNEPQIRKRKAFGVASVFAVFQALMPLIGWFCVRTAAERFKEFEPFIPWISLILLCFIGGKMLVEGIRKKEEEGSLRKLGIGALLVQGVATSIDALSVGFTIADYDLVKALICVLIIAVVTLIICVLGVAIGKKFGTRFSGKASVFGGVILIGIGLEIFLTGILGG